MGTILKYTICFILLSPVLTQAQLTADVIERVSKTNIAGVTQGVQVQTFYDFLGHHPQWIVAEKKDRKDFLFNLLTSSNQYALNPRDYQYDLLQELRDNTARFNSPEDSARADILISDAAIHFFSDLSFGNQAAAIGYNGLNYTPRFFNVAQKLSELVSKSSTEISPSYFESSKPEYAAIKNKLAQYLAVAAKPGFKEVIVTSNILSSSNRPLLTKLDQLGFTDSSNRKITNTELRDLIKKIQKLFNFKQDGILSKNLLADLNVPIATRINELSLSLNLFRWMDRARQDGPAIIVNIPSASLLVYEANRLILSSKIIVGKPSTPTPTFTSTVNQVILYPYWMVPNKIAVKELLPSISRDIGFLERNNYQVLNRNGQVVNPYSINWSGLSASNFPYILRQSTGCDNSLGIVKLNFYTPYGVFLHDTPGKTLFSYSRRYFSHGCMRVEKAIELAHLILKGNEIAIDTLEEKGCLQHQYPVIVPANNPMAVFVLYSTAWIDADLFVNFSPDIYRKLQPARRN